MEYNYSNNHEDNFQDETAEVIGYCALCDREVMSTEKYYHFDEYDMVCPHCVENSNIIAKCEKCDTYFIVKDMKKYEFGDEIHYYCSEHEPK